MGNESKHRYGTVIFERRKHPRFSIDFPVEYWHIDNPGNHQGRAANVSEGGLLLYIAEEIEIGQILKVKLFFDSGPELKRVEAKVQAVWKEFRMEKERDYRLGVKFVDISPEALQELRNLIISLMHLEVSSIYNLPLSLQSARGILIITDATNPKRESLDEIEPVLPE